MSEDTITREEGTQEGTQEGTSTQEGTQEGTTTQEGTSTQEGTQEGTQRRKTPDTTKVAVDDINAAELAIPELIAAAAPMRERNDQQKAMDRVAVRAYAAWVKAGRPSVWTKIPVITYFLDQEDVPRYKFLIRRACAIVEPQGDAPGVRVRFGNEFTLSETMAAKMKDENHPNGRPELAGKQVLAWAAVDKRAVEDGNKTKAESDAKTDAADDGKRPGQRGRGKRS